MATKSRFARKMFCLDIFLTYYLDFTKTIIPLALIASESIAHSAFGLIDSEPIRAREIIVNETLLDEQV